MSRWFETRLLEVILTYLDSGSYVGLGGVGSRIRGV